MCDTALEIKSQETVSSEKDEGLQLSMYTLSTCICRHGLKSQTICSGDPYHSRTQVVFVSDIGLCDSSKNVPADAAHAGILSQVVCLYRVLSLRYKAECKSLLQVLCICSNTMWLRNLISCAVGLVLNRGVEIIFCDNTTEFNSKLKDPGRTLGLYVTINDDASTIQVLSDIIENEGLALWFMSVSLDNLISLRQHYKVLLHSQIGLPPSGGPNTSLVAVVGSSEVQQNPEPDEVVRSKINWYDKRHRCSRVGRYQCRDCLSIYEFLLLLPTSEETVELCNTLRISHDRPKDKNITIRKQ